MAQTPSVGSEEAPRVSLRGYGHAGYCRICAWDKAKELNAKIKAGKNAAEVQRWAGKYEFTFNRQTFYKHRNEHMMSRADRVVQASALVPEAEKLRLATDEEVLRGIRDLGYANALANPDSVNVGHALKAISVLTAAKNQPTNILVVLARAMTTPLAEIEGEYAEYDPPLIESPR